MDSILTRIEQEVKSEFDRTNRILTFDDYLELVKSEPRLHTRGSAQYFIDVMEHFGVEQPKGGQKRFKLFDMEFDDPRFRVINETEVQNEIHSTLQNFVREGVNNKLILLHGPNGSAKSSIVNCLMRGAEKYGELPQGAQYRFNWIFPVEKVVKGELGLGSYSGSKTTVSSFAKLPEHDIAAKLTCELKDHPLLLFPLESRKQVFEQFFKGDVPNLPDYLTKGNLCHKCKMIYEALLTAHKGDLRKVLMHVQVERFYMSKRYRNAAVTIEPQLHVDAQSRQITMDKSIASLPPSLQSLSLYELSGDLVDGNRGIIEYADLLKRPVDTFKYLLITCETGSLNVGSSIAHLDAVLIGSTNELQLDAFKEFPDFTSFKARIELVRVPYILEYSQEKKIYDVHIQKIAGSKHVAPHTTHVVSLWAVLTRLKKPNAVHYPPNLANIVGALTPIEKAQFYDHGLIPEHVSAEDKKVLRTAQRRLREEYNAVPYYEGRMGASAREIKNILFDAAQNPEFPCLSPLAAFQEMDTFVKRVSEYDFLKQDIKEGYHDNSEFIATARTEYMNIVDKEVRNSMGVFETHQYEDFLKKYILHVSTLLKKESLRNAITGKSEPPDQGVIDEFENIIGVGSAPTDREAFRNQCISTIGAYALDHPKEKVDYRVVFPDLMKKLEDHYFNEQKAQIGSLKDAIELLGTDREDQTDDHYKLAKRTLAAMATKHGYCEHCAKQAILFLVKAKY